MPFSQARVTNYVSKIGSSLLITSKLHYPNMESPSHLVGGHESTTSRLDPVIVSVIIDPFFVIESMVKVSTLDTNLDTIACVVYHDITQEHVF